MACTRTCGHNLNGETTKGEEERRKQFFLLAAEGEEEEEEEEEGVNYLFLENNRLVVFRMAGAGATSFITAIFKFSPFSSLSLSPSLSLSLSPSLSNSLNNMACA